MNMRKKYGIYRGPGRKGWRKARDDCPNLIRVNNFIMPNKINKQRRVVPE